MTQKCVWIYLYLGDLLDSGLKMNSHVQMVYDKCIKKMGLIAKTRHLFDKQTSRLLYITTVLPVIDYCSSVYMVANQTELDKLQKLQNVALRIVNQLNIMCPIYELHHQAKIDTLATRREKGLLKLCWKWVHGDGPKALCSMMEPREVVMYQTRLSQQNPPVIPKVKTAMGARSINHRATTAWISAREEFKQCTKLEQLKRKMQTVWDTWLIIV